MTIFKEDKLIDKVTISNGITVELSEGSITENDLTNYAKVQCSGNGMKTEHMLFFAGERNCIDQYMLSMGVPYETIELMIDKLESVEL